jgi:protocatechuate 3,4-dioxygenase beta subunit
MKTSFKTVQLMLMVILVFTLTLTSCKKDDDNPDPVENNDFSDNFGNEVNRDFMGRIIDTSHNPVSGAAVRIGSESTTTDDNGIFIMEDVSVFERFAYVEVEKSGYLKGSRSLVPTDGMNQVSIMLLDENIVGTVPSGADGEVNLPNGTTVKFDGAFKDENGNAYTGNVTVMMQHLDPSDDEITLKMPGMLYAQDSDNNEKVLETYGMINVELRGSGGEKLNIADGHTATIELPVDPAQTNAPNSIPLWHFDEEKGYWIEDGTADLIGGKYIGQVSHFSWWNCDAPFPTVNLCMTIEDTNGNPVYGVVVELWMSNATYPRTGWSNGNGEICGLIPANETLTMEIIDPCGAPISTSTIGPFSADTNLGVITIPAAQTVVVTGTLLDCNNNPVTDGYVVLESGSYANNNYINLSYTVTNGSFTFTTFPCNTLTSFTLEGIDNTGFQTTGEVSYTFTPPTTNIGNLIACSTIDEYITYQIDNDPAVTFITNISANYYAPNYSINASENGQQSYFYIGVNAPFGTYSYGSDLSMEFNNIDYSQPINITATVSTDPLANVGEYIDINFSGTFTEDNSGNVRSITGVVHVLRDN